MKNLKLLKKALFLLNILLLFFISANAQEDFTVTGTVLDELDVPLPGASVVEKGTANGTSTDFDGNYTLSVSGPNAVLVIGYIGYAEQEIPVNGKSVINTKMEPSASTLDEVVLVGYGALRKKTLQEPLAK